MTSSLIPLLRRVAIAAVLVLAGLAAVPAVASAHPTGNVRLLGTEPVYKATTLTMPDGTRFRGGAGLFRLRITPVGGTPVERRGFCVDALHPFPTNVDFTVYLNTPDFDPRLTTPRYAEAAWLLQSAEALIAAAAPERRALEAGALQTAVWQLTDQAREVNPSDDAALNARTAELRRLAAGRAIGGPLTLAATAERGCAGRGSVALELTGTPGSSATLAVTGGPGTVSPAEVRFGADGTARAAVSSPAPGTVTVVARAEGGTPTRITRRNAGATRPQETLYLEPRSYTATASVAFEDCAVVPFEGGGTPTPPATPVGPLETPVSKPVVPTTPPSRTTPRKPAQSGPRYTVTKTGPRRVVAGDRARYTITVVNRGTTVLRDLTLSDALPRGMSLLRTPAGSRLRGGSLAWSLTALKPGARRSVTVDVRIDADIAGRRCNRATVESPIAGARSATACTRVTPLSRVLNPAVTA